VSDVKQFEVEIHQPETVLWRGLIAAGSDHMTSINSAVDWFPTIVECSEITSGLDQKDRENIPGALIGFSCCLRITFRWILHGNMNGTGEHHPSGLAMKRGPWRRMMNVEGQMGND
jgi:ABC-type iron transport system FetAB ATPase subunit